MRRIVIIAAILSLPLISCQVENSVNYEKDTPVWLKAKIDSMANDLEYYGTKVYRYQWHRSFVYQIEIPISSCAYCELYDEYGEKIQFFTDIMIQDFLRNMKNEVLIWEWKE